MRVMKRSVKIILAALSFGIGCTNNSSNVIIKKEFYPNGNLKEISKQVTGEKTDSVWRYDSDGHLKELFLYENHILNGPARTFFSNGQVKEAYNYKDGFVIGKSTKYDSTGKEIAQKEYIVRNNESILNKYIYQSESPNPSSCFFYDLFYLKDTVESNESFNLSIKMKCTPYQYYRIIYNESEPNAKFPIKPDTLLQKRDATTYTIHGTLSGRKPGINTLRGHIDAYDTIIRNGDSSIAVTRSYFEHPYFVK
jgi:hypothetical protein